MNFVHDLYQQTIAENDKNIKFWEDYLNNLNSLDFDVYSEKLTVPVLIPIGNRILFRGNLKHTNEVTVALGADYFAKCSIKQADVLRQHRIKDAKSKLEVYYKEREYLESQLSFNQQVQDVGQEIIEHCTEEEDKEWRKAHRKRVRQYHQSKSKRETSEHDNVDDEELFRRLEELELQEELENELSKHESAGTDNAEENYDSFVINVDKDYQSKEVALIPQDTLQQTSKLDLLQQVIDRQKVLETKLIELKNRDKVQATTEKDLLSRLDEIEQLEELEDEMERLDDILDEDSNVEESNDDESIVDNKTANKQSVTFHEDDSETLELTFKHSEQEPTNEPYDSNKGITKPSDVYSAFSNLFVNETKSILKKSKYESQEFNHVNDIKKEVKMINESIKKEESEHRTIVIKDISEKVEPEAKNTSSERPVSIFKKRRQQQKT
ncbi:unconventional prefoldin RPB5 interactor [Aricia agestis]|uniref:unconventional prefoldin RPB5 interactor n=1 Tax=Aricia agestis TaxID=91739 RepID=UPI001C20493F|nr:unconventional prefoldin RPB5 interactor [Aricia agestis]